MVSRGFSIFAIILLALNSAVNAIPARPRSPKLGKGLAVRQGTSSDGSGCQSSYGSCSGSSNTADSSSRPQLGNVPYGSTIYGCTVPGTVALTFDDGPYIYTSALLDKLQNYGARATFFLNGQNWGNPITEASNRASVQRMINEGHQVGSHTWSHADLSGLSVASMTSQMTQLETALLDIIGKYPTYMRPPYFSCSTECLSTITSLGYHVINTNLDTNDWQGSIPNSEKFFADTVNPSNTARDSFLVLAHDVHDTTVSELADYMLKTLQAKGYKAVTVGECLGDSSANWYRTA
ncbi:hypothetical protein RUND412_008165 [Rhizina undulata]